MITPANINETTTRATLIDLDPARVDWNVGDRTQVRFEVPVDEFDAEPWNGVTDNCLYEAAGQVIAVIEAKRTSRNLREREEQLRQYVDENATRQTFRYEERLAQHRKLMAGALRAYYVAL